MTEQTGPTADPLRTDQITELDVALRDSGVLHVYDTLGSRGDRNT